MTSNVKPSSRYRLTGTPGDDYTDQFTVCFTADGKLVTGNRLMMPVMLPDVLVGVTKRDGS